MYVNDKMKLLRLAHEESKDLLEEADGLPACGDILQQLELAEKFMEHFDWLLDNDKEVPHWIMELI